MPHKKQLYQAMGKSMVAKYTVYAVNLLSTIWLARLFTPELFGTVAAIMVFFTFFQLISEVGLGPAVVNINTLTPTDRNGIFGLTLLIGAGMSLLFYALSPVFTSFYKLPRVDEVVPYVAISLFFSAAGILPNAFLMRQQAFFHMAIAGLCSQVVATLAAVFLVQVIDPLHALASRAVFGAVASFMAAYYFSAVTEFGRPVWGRKLSAIKPLLSFSMYQFGFNFINYFSRNLDNILVGKYLGASSLGVYEKAYQLMAYPLQLLTHAFTPAIQPVLRQYANDVEKIEHIHRDFTFKLSLLGAAAGLAMFLLAELIVKVALGPNWGGVVPLIQVLAIAIPVQIVLSTSGSFFQTMNRPDLLFISGFLSAIVMVAAIIWGIVQRDMIAMAWALVAAFHFNFFQAYFVMYSRIFKVNLLKFFTRMIPAGAVISGMVWFAHASFVS
jgi:PST family polysaccharide transporter